MKRKKLSLKFTLRLAFHGIFSSPLRLCVAVLLGVVSFALTELAVAMSFYEKEEAKIQTYEEYVDYFLIYSESALSAAALSALSETFQLPYGTTAELTSAFSVIGGSFSETDILSAQISGGVHYQTAVSLAGYFPAGMFSALGRTVTGTDLLQNGEILISSCLANTLLYCQTYEDYGEGYAGLCGNVFSIGEKSYTIAGVYDCSGCALEGSEMFGACETDILSWRGAVYFSEEDFFSLETEIYGAYFLADHSAETGEVVRDFLNGNAEFVSDIFYELEAFEADFARIKTAFSSAAAVLVFFSCLLLYQFISIMTDAKRRMFAILRALGGDVSDCGKIAFCESLALGAAIGLCGAAVGVALTAPFNLAFNAIFSVSVAVLRFQPIAFMLPPLLGLLAGFLSGILPVLRIKKISPAESLRTP